MGRCCAGGVLTALRCQPCCSIGAQAAVGVRRGAEVGGCREVSAASRWDDTPQGAAVCMSPQWCLCGLWRANRAVPRVARVKTHRLCGKRIRAPAAAATAALPAQGRSALAKGRLEGASCCPAVGQGMALCCRQHDVDAAQTYLQRRSLIDRGANAPRGWYRTQCLHSKNPGL